MTVVDLDALKTKAQEISANLLASMGDQGSCVMSYEIHVDGKKFIDQPAQGSLTCQKVYEDVTWALIGGGVALSRIRIYEGNMD